MIVDGECIGRRFSVGACVVDIVGDGILTLPGAGIFDGVSESDWARYAPPVADGQVALAVSAFLIHAHRELILVDTGFGAFGPAQRDLSRPGGSLMDRLGQLGVSSSQVDVVVNTHLHLDHAGGDFSTATRSAVPAFPNARYVVQAREFDFASRVAPAGQSFYDIDSLAWLRAFPELHLIEGSVGLSADGLVTAVPSPGHTAGHQSVVVESGADRLAIIGDVAPLRAHLERPEWLSPVDADPVLAQTTKRQILDWAMKHSAIVAMTHDARAPYRVHDDSASSFNAA
jgi:glyoxylase-like metal-dependent hydrolase (beta-lactamase superfamily II)